MCAEITYEGLQHWGPVGLLDPQELINLGHGEYADKVNKCSYMSVEMNQRIFRVTRDP